MALTTSRTVTRMNKTNYKQYDTRWASLPYPKKPWVIKDCGCGEVSICNCIIEMNQYINETPKTIQPYCKQFAAPNGDGTYFAGIPEMMKHYGMTEVKEHQTMKPLWDELAKGDRVAIYLMGSRNGGTKGVHWTSGGHFVCSTAYKYEGGKHWVYVKDSYSTSDWRNGWITYEDNMCGAVLRVWSGKLDMSKLVVDGIGGKQTVTRLQQFLGVKEYGEFTVTEKNHKKHCPAFTAVEYGDSASPTVEALQKWLGFSTCDGWFGEITAKNLQLKIGTPKDACDGIIGSKSMKRLQEYLNTHDKAVYPKKQSPYYSKTVIIGEARCNEKGTLSGGKAGDQTGREVGMGDWYDGGWLTMYRAKDPAVRLKIAQAMIDTCNNSCIGYNIDNPARFGAWDNAEAKNHDIKGISKKGDTTCSQAVSMCLRAAGISKEYAPRFCDMAVLTKVMKDDKAFTRYTSKTYTATSKNLQAGDILLSSHHTVVVVKSPNNK